jgi:hypothetical protein
MKSIGMYSLNYFKLRKTPNICFIWIPKTAGTTIFLDLSQQLGMLKLKKHKQYITFPNFGTVTFCHVHYLSLRTAGVISDKYHRSSYKFSITRRPYERAVSLYNYLTNDTKIKYWNFDFFLDQVMTKRPPVGLYNSYGISQTNPQVDWILDENGESFLNESFKIEDLEFLYKSFSDAYGISFAKDRRENVSPKRITVKNDIIPVRERIEKINDIYSRDFELLGYERL